MNRIGWALFSLLLLSACGGGEKVLRYEVSEKQAKVWPQPPEKARFRYVGQLMGESDFYHKNQGEKVGGFFKWLLTGLVGKTKPQMLQRPQSGVVDEQGRVYVSDVNRQAVYVFDPVAGEMKIWEWAGKSTRFIAPIGMALIEGRLFVADAELGYVVILDPKTGNAVGKIDEKLYRPTGIAVDEKRKRIYVSDTRKHHIKVYSYTGRLLKTIGAFGSNKGEFNAPTYLAYRDDRLYVADTLNARIQILRFNGEVIRVFGRRGMRKGDFSRPKGIAVDESGLIYVVESFYDHLLVFNDKGQLLLPIGGEGKGVGQFYLPAGVWVAQSKIYVADMFNARVVVLKYLEGV